MPTIEYVYGELPPVTVSAALLNTAPTSPVFPVARQVNCGPATIVYGQLPVAATPFASVTWIENVPAAVGVPVTAPVDVFSVRPAGNVPTIEYVYGDVPPVTVSAALLNTAPTSPDVPAAKQVNCGPAPIVYGQLPVAATPFASVTWIENVPAAVGVPVTAPVDVFSVKPAGNVPTIEYVYGDVPPVTVSAALLNTAPTSPDVPVARQVNCGPATIVYGQLPVAATPFASVTWIENVPAAVGVPVTAPVDVFSVKPAGNVPTIEYVYGELPPVTVSAALLNTAPTSPVFPVARQVNCGPATIVYGQLPVAATPFASVTWIENVPAAVGVPVTAPVDVFSVRPAGNVPTIEYVYGDVPPVTVSAALLNTAPTSPDVPVVKQVNCGPATIVYGQLPVAATPFASVTWIENVPAAVGVPVTAPVDVFSVKPAGNVPTIEYVYGELPPVTVSAALLNAAPTSPVVPRRQASQLRTRANRVRTASRRRHSLCIRDLDRERARRRRRTRDRSRRRVQRQARRQRAHDRVRVGRRSARDRERCAVEYRSYFAGRARRQAGQLRSRNDRVRAGCIANHSTRICHLDRECARRCRRARDRARRRVQGQPCRQRAHDRVRVRRAFRP